MFACMQFNSSQKRVSMCCRSARVILLHFYLAFMPIMLHEFHIAAPAYYSDLIGHVSGWRCPSWIEAISFGDGRCHVNRLQTTYDDIASCAISIRRRSCEAISVQYSLTDTQSAFVVLRLLRPRTFDASPSVSGHTAASSQLPADKCPRCEHSESVDKRVPPCPVMGSS